MNILKLIRERLDLTQRGLADLLGCSQGNVANYEGGRQTIPPAVAGKLIDICAGRCLQISFDHIYGTADLPDLDKAEPAPAGIAAEPAAAGQEG